MTNVKELREFLEQFQGDEEVVVDSNEFNEIIQLYKCEDTGKCVLLITE